MTREEFESILEEAYIEGYNSAIEDIQEDILNEEAYDLEGEYDYYTESKNVRKQMDKLQHKDDKQWGSTYSRTYYPSNPKQDWTKFSAAADDWSDDTHHNELDKNPRNYVVSKHIGAPNSNTPARGRIKSDTWYKDDDPRSMKLRQKVAANAERRRKELKEKLKPFKNKGNKY